MIVRDGVYYQRRWQTGFDGADTNIEEMKIDYVIGAGDHARSYLHRTDLGTLIELPLGWYSERGGYWAMSPGFDSHHPQTRRLVSYECMFCHNGYPQNPTANQARSPEPVFSGELPQGIDCQRCHGPGAVHVRTAQTPGAKPADISASIVNPARLNPKLQMEVCMQCHLEPTSGRIPSLIRRFNRAPYSDAVPGQPLEDFILYFDYPAGKGHDDKFKLPARLSPAQVPLLCGKQRRADLPDLPRPPPEPPDRGSGALVPSPPSAWAATNPHSAHWSPPASIRLTPIVFPATCPSGEQRMWSMRSSRTAFIQRQIPSRDLLAELPERHLTDAEFHGEVVPYYPSPLLQTGENPLYQAVAQVALQNNLKQGLDHLSREMSRQPPREMEFYTTLGEAYRNSGDAKQAAAAFQQAVLRSPDSVTALQSLSGSLQGMGEVQRSEETLKRALRMHPRMRMSGFNTACWTPASVELESQSRRCRRRSR